MFCALSSAAVSAHALPLKSAGHSDSVASTLSQRGIASPPIGLPRREITEVTAALLR
jgi:hypothetical protein